MVLNPSVNVNVIDDITLTEQGGPGIIAIMSTAQWGPINELQIFNSFSQALEVFKEDADGLFLIKGLDVAYQNLAQIVKAIRIVDGSELKSTLALAGAGPTPNVITVNALYPGTYGNNILVTIGTVGSGRSITITDGILTEVFDNDGNPNGYTTNAAIVSAVNGNSRLVELAVNDVALVTAISNQALTGGTNGEAPIQSDYTDAFDTYLANEDWDILIIPGRDSLEATDGFQSTILGKVNTRALNDKKYGIYISGVVKNETIATMQTRIAAGERLVLVAPSIRYTPRFQGASQDIFNGSLLACALAGQLAGNDVEISPTRKVCNVEGVSVNETTGKQYYTLGEVESILVQRIIPITRLGGTIKYARGVTRIANRTDIDFEVNIVRIKDYLRGKVELQLDSFLGEPNLARVRSIIGTICDGILQQSKLDEVIVDFLPTEVTVGISPDTVLVNMKVQPTFAINFINVNLVITRVNGGV